jgi:DNA-binding response OmpR family regulator
MSRKILIIEDEVTMRRNVALMLELEGHTPLVADSGLEGIEMARNDRPDLILCDVMMPGMDGYTVLGMLRAEESMRGIPFVFLTARGDSQDVRHGLELGADAYLTKPVTREDLLAAVEACLKA